MKKEYARTAQRLTRPSQRTKVGSAHSRTDLWGGKWPDRHDPVKPVGTAAEKTMNPIIPEEPEIRKKAGNSILGFEEEESLTTIIDSVM